MLFLEASHLKAADSLFILGSNGILTEHMLTPQKATGVPDGDDAPIELYHKPELEWDLLRYSSGIHVLSIYQFILLDNLIGLNQVLLTLKIVLW